MAKARAASSILTAVHEAAAVLNVGKATVCAWEQGVKTPSGPALKLLDLVERKGLAVLA